VATAFAANLSNPVHYLGPYVDYVRRGTQRESPLPHTEPQAVAAVQNIWSQMYK